MFSAHNGGVTPDPPPRPTGVLRASAAPWVGRLAVAAAVVVAGSAAVLLDAVPSGVPLTLVRVGVLLAFALVVASLAIITVRWRTSVRSDGSALVVRGPWGASVLPFTEGLSLGRWVDERRGRPVLWAVDHETLVAELGAQLDPVRVEAFALRVGVPVIDHEGPPPTRERVEDDDRYR